MIATTHGEGGDPGTHRVAVLGSLNADLFARVERHPLPGETVLGDGGQARAGGKGANQAVAAALSGARVRMIGAVGSDGHAEVAVAGLRRSGCDLTGIRQVEGPTGLALITVDAAGENSIIVVPGANFLVGDPELAQLADLHAGDFLITQGELPVPVAAAAVRRAVDVGARPVINLAPVVDYPAEALLAANPLIVNEHEGLGAAKILGVDVSPDCPPADVICRLVDAGVASVVMTLGSHGALLLTAAAREAGPVNVPAESVTVVDTTGAGDAFVGALVASLAAGGDLVEAARRATRFAALSVTREGAQDSYPTDNSSEDVTSS
ncbi:Ribokinase [Austwickia sp. TVS 96-490-7B]|uniref:ribokinase n=1 Tax=Austwickia sp. TVS 96-490-7B TaxID=2830843 RepID=UPI001DF30416|nr:ribokinase [Austwickia sp. TVS 96-490-7B]MBW3085023.1 Ribokinase [Austwickia sp. TVS 96-490-7B]